MDNLRKQVVAFILFLIPATLVFGGPQASPSSPIKESALRAHIKFLADRGERQFQDFNTRHYHQPSDEYSDTWDLRGMVQEAETAPEIGTSVANMKDLPRFNPGDEFSKVKR